MKHEYEFIYFILSKNRISEEVKYAFSNPDYDSKNPHIMGLFLGYHDFFNVRNRKTKSVGGIQFHFMKDRYETKKNQKELIYGFRIRNAKITPKVIQNMNSLMKKYQKCIKKHLHTLFPEFVVELSIKLNP